jgi:hypothetical protein
MISTATLMLGKSLLSAGVALGFCYSQLRALKRMRREGEERRQAAEAEAESCPARSEGEQSVSEKAINLSDTEPARRGCA